MTALSYGGQESLSTNWADVEQLCRYHKALSLTIKLDIHHN